jgi:hypothetical protein
VWCLWDCSVWRRRSKNLQYRDNCTHSCQNYLVAISKQWMAYPTNATRHREDFLIALRSRSNLNIPFARLHSSTFQPWVKLPRLWSESENENFKISRDKYELIQQLKKLFLNKMSSVLQCTRMLCPACHLSLCILPYLNLVYYLKAIFLTLLQSSSKWSQSVCFFCTLGCIYELFKLEIKKVLFWFLNMNEGTFS